ncbi:hypothetical protein [Nonomuraea longispora]|uniref:hypothetical protein n=1 Tax=Nonomuraea longispora TaxID=1848320 RepID=UPI0014047649|nr:hypothetical protein [Nonomuraea longispora]
MIAVKAGLSTAAVTAYAASAAVARLPRTAVPTRPATWLTIMERKSGTAAAAIVRC